MSGALVRRDVLSLREMLPILRPVAGYLVAKRFPGDSKRLKTAARDFLCLAEPVGLLKLTAKFGCTEVFAQVGKALLEGQ